MCIKYTIIIQFNPRKIYIFSTVGTSTSIILIYNINLKIARVLDTKTSQ